MRSLRDLTQHFTTRADDSHAAPVSQFPKAPIHLWKVLWMSRRVRFFALHRIKPHAPPLVRAPSIHLSFNLAAVLPGGRLNALARKPRLKGTTSKSTSFTAWTTGYLILFAPHAFAPERQSSSGAAFATGIPPDLYAFHRYTEFYPLYETQACQYQMQFPRLSPGISHLT